LTRLIQKAFYLLKLIVSLKTEWEMGGYLEKSVSKLNKCKKDHFWCQKSIRLIFKAKKSTKKECIKLRSLPNYFPRARFNTNIFLLPNSQIVVF